MLKFLGYMKLITILLGLGLPSLTFAAPGGTVILLRGTAKVDGAKTLALKDAVRPGSTIKTEAKSFDPDKVIAAMGGQSFKAPSGFTVKMDEKNHHLHKPVFIGEVKGDGQFNVVWKTKGPIKAQPWSPFIEGNDKKKDEPEKK